VDFDEPARSGKFSRCVTAFAKWRDRGHEDDHPDVIEETRQLADSADVLDASGVAESEIAIQSVAKGIAVEVMDSESEGHETLLDDQGDR
jgi:hypothetical protein